MILILVIGWFASRWVLVRAEASVPFASMRITRLTSHGQIVEAAISPDGKYVAYALDETGGESIWTSRSTCRGFRQNQARSRL